MHYPGSVGQPRDKDPRASYALIDLNTGETEFRHVTYDLKETPKKHSSSTPAEWLALRLEIGI